MPTKEFLRARFEYKDGSLIYRAFNKPGIKPGTVAGFFDSNNNRCSVRILRKPYQLHRLIWVYHNDLIPAGLEIDHIDHDPRNNRIENLRLVTHRENGLNIRRAVNNKSGHTGVFYRSANRKWCAEIGLNGRRVHLGLFDDIAEAVAARKIAERRLGYHPNHGT